MVQGAPKKVSKAGSNKPTKSKTLGPKPGAKVIKPKKNKLIARNKILKKYSAGFTAMTEKNLAERAGHLELLSGGKKDKKKGIKETKNRK